MKTQQSIIALSVFSVLAGCAASDSTIKKNDPERVIGGMNQPNVIELTEVTDPLLATGKTSNEMLQEIAQMEPKTTSESKKTQNTTVTATQVKLPVKPVHLYQSESTNNIDTSPVTTGIKQIDSDQSKTDLIQTNWATQGKTTTVRPFKLNEGESFAETLTQWLNMEGYKHVKIELRQSDDIVFNVDVDQSDVYTTTFTDAVERLSHLVQMQDIRPDHYNLNRRHPREFRVFITLNKQEQTATIRSVTSMFDIRQGKDASQLETVKQSYTIYKGENYQSAMARWTHKAGFEKFGELLDKPEQLVLKQTADHTQIFNESLATASTKLMRQARLQAMNEDRDERSGFISEAEKMDIELHLNLDTHKREAIITSKNTPVTMFTVAPGSLRDNFMRMAFTFNWKAAEANYLTKDYWVEFGYPIVAETENFKGALEKLLSDYPTLKGAIVPSIHQAYVISETE